MIGLKKGLLDFLTNSHLSSPLRLSFSLSQIAFAIYDQHHRVSNESESVEDDESADLLRISKTINDDLDSQEQGICRGIMMMNDNLLRRTESPIRFIEKGWMMIWLMMLGSQLPKRKTRNWYRLSIHVPQNTRQNYHY
jgi:hypothetical protein